MDYIRPEERIPGLEAAVKAAQEKFDKNQTKSQSEEIHAELEKAKTALSQGKVLAGIAVGRFRDRE